MICTCGALIPPDTPIFLTKRQQITKRDEKGRRIEIWVTAIIRCPSRKTHAPNTAWNYLEWAIHRGVV